MESVQDLLAPERDNIAIQEDPKTGDVSIPGATQVQLQDQTSFVRLLDVGEANRFAANTKLNTESSRSHAMLLVGSSSFAWVTCTISLLLFLQTHSMYFSSHKLMHEIVSIMSVYYTGLTDFNQDGNMESKKFHILNSEMFFFVLKLLSLRLI